jgi:hypothetical protein
VVHPCRTVYPISGLQKHHQILRTKIEFVVRATKIKAFILFEEAPSALGLSDAPELDNETAALNGFLATSGGVELALAFGRIRNARLRRAIVALVEQIVAEPVAEPEGTVH